MHRNRDAPSSSSLVPSLHPLPSQHPQFVFRRPTILASLIDVTPSHEVMAFSEMAQISGLVQSQRWVTPVDANAMMVHFLALRGYDVAGLVYTSPSIALLALLEERSLGEFLVFVIDNRCGFDGRDAVGLPTQLPANAWTLLEDDPHQRDVLLFSTSTLTEARIPSTLFNTRVMLFKKSDSSMRFASRWVEEAMISDWDECFVLSSIAGDAILLGP